MYTTITCSPRGCLSLSLSLKCLNPSDSLLRKIVLYGRRYDLENFNPAIAINASKPRTSKYTFPSIKDQDSLKQKETTTSKSFSSKQPAAAAMLLVLLQVLQVHCPLAVASMRLGSSRVPAIRRLPCLGCLGGGNVGDSDLLSGCYLVVALFCCVCR
jgi:hypothetical protein